MLGWLPPDEGLVTIRLESATRIEDALLSNSVHAGPGVFSRFAAAIDTHVGGPIRARLEARHSMTDYPCRLPDGRIGRVAAIAQDGEWTLVCRIA